MGIMTEWKRSHKCGDLNKEDKGSNVVLVGWAARVRDHGGVVFISLRDRWGVTQVVVNPDNKDYNTAKSLHMESVIGVKGRVALRPEGQINKNMKTGEIEVIADEIVALNPADPLPLMIAEESDASEELRLTYRYLDLRRPQMQKNIILRHKAAQIVRRFFDENEFLEIETPYLMKSTPEGARDYLVPSRNHPGRFYALPQSPQTYKQILMISSFDRYFQIVRCFRDEDLRADRQPEFTQIDVEMSFIDENDIIDVVERLMQRLFKEAINRDLKIPFPRIDYNTAMEQYGSDAPDIRFDLKLNDLSDLVRGSDFGIFKSTIEAGGAVKGIYVPEMEGISRKNTDEITEFVSKYGAKGVITIQKREGKIVSPVKKHVGQELLQQIWNSFEAKESGVVFIIAAGRQVCNVSLGALRKKIAKDLDLIPQNEFALTWVVDFPLFEYDEDEKRFVAMHHPFTSPKLEDIDKLGSEPEKVMARAYDLVLNGTEIAGGSIRNYRSDVQEKLFEALGMDEETIKHKFGFLVEALKYGAPPHGGIAFGFDRLIAIMAGEDSIRNVIPFPKTTSAYSLMDGAPSEVDENQLKELGILVAKQE